MLHKRHLRWNNVFQWIFRRTSLSGFRIMGEYARVLEGQVSPSFHSQSFILKTVVGFGNRESQLLCAIDDGGVYKVTDNACVGNSPNRVEINEFLPPWEASCVCGTSSQQYSRREALSYQFITSNNNTTNSSRNRSNPDSNSYRHNTTLSLFIPSTFETIYHWLTKTQWAEVFQLFWILLHICR